LIPGINAKTERILYVTQEASPVDILRVVAGRDNVVQAFTAVDNESVRAEKQFE
jgi:hypothetical protein